MKHSEKGFGAVKLVVGLVVLAAIVFGILFFASDVFSTRVKSGYRQFADWTPENIAKDPENYLNFCEEQANKALTDLKANSISIAQSRGSLDNMLEKAKEKVRAGEKALPDLKKLYEDAEKANSWPCKWNGQEFDKPTMQKQIISFNRQIEGQKKVQGTVESGIKKLDAQKERIEDARTKAQEQISEIKTNREMLKVNKITNELTDRLVSMKGALQTAVAAVGDTKGTITLDQLTESQAGAVDETEFNKIMGGSGK